MLTLGTSMGYLWSRISYYDTIIDSDKTHQLFSIVELNEVSEFNRFQEIHLTSIFFIKKSPPLKRFHNEKTLLFKLSKK